MCHAFFQSLIRKKEGFLFRCDRHIELDDQPPYYHIVEGLGDLKDAIVPRRFPSKAAKRKAAKKLRSILEGLFKKAKAGAKAGKPGLAAVLASEISGESSMPAFRRFDAWMRSNRVQASVSSGIRASGPPQARGVVRRGGEGQRDLARVQCYNCRQNGHMRANCPLPQRPRPDQGNIVN